MSSTTRSTFASLIAVIIFASPVVQRAEGRFEQTRVVLGKQQIPGALVSDFAARQLRFETGGSVAFQVPFDRISALHYERTATPRYAAAVLVAWPLIFTKSKHHFLTIQYADGAGERRFHILRLHKNGSRLLLQTLEADTGIKIERSAEE